MVDWNFGAAVEDLNDLVKRLNDFVMSLRFLRDVKGIKLVTGTQRIAHGGRSVPRQVKVIVVGASASTAIVTRGAMDKTHLFLHATANCTVDLEVTDGSA